MGEFTIDGLQAVLSIRNLAVSVFQPLGQRHITAAVEIKRSGTTTQKEALWWPAVNRLPSAADTMAKPQS